MPIMRWLQKLFSSRPAPADVDRSTLRRNDPCWCGSGKKYKKCHLAKDSAERIEAAYAARVAAQRPREGGLTRSAAKPKARPQEANEWKGGKGDKS